MQICAGSVCIALGGLVGYAIMSTCYAPSGHKALSWDCGKVFVAVVAVLEAVRLGLGALVLWLHKRENIAVP